jgi:hypothetical protein
VTDDLELARQRRDRHRSTRPVGAFGPSGRKQAAISRVTDKVDQAAERNHPADYYAGKVPTPERITIALDMRDLYGPEVDRALGGEEPMVDEWESGARVPGLAQVQALAKLTGFPVRFFYMPPPPPLDNGWMCGSGGCRPLGEQAGRDGKCPTCGHHAGKGSPS